VTTKKRYTGEDSMTQKNVYNTIEEYKTKIKNGSFFAAGLKLISINQLLTPKSQSKSLQKLLKKNIDFQTFTVFKI
jgi:hypothetical protein